MKPVACRRVVIDDDGQFRMTRIPLSHGASSYTMDGKPAVKTMRTDDSGVDNIGALCVLPLSEYLEPLDGGSCDQLPDVAFGKNKTQLVTRWLVPEDAVEGVDYDLDHLTHVWIQTNAQDAALVAECQIGTQSPGYQPGRISDIEEKWGRQFRLVLRLMTKKLKPIIPLKTTS